MAEVSFGEWLKRRRSALGLTQEQLARQINCSTSALRKMEAELRRPSAPMVEQLANIFNIPQQERKSFVRFARGDWQAISEGDYADTPWRASAAHAEKPRETLTPRNNLPLQLTSFIGREKEVAEIIDLITKHRLVTLVGAGGIGKTRLSLEAARKVLHTFPDGLWFIEFAPLTEAALVPQVTVNTLGLIEQANRPPQTILIDFLKDKQALLIFDNCEHLIEACAQLAESLLRACPDLKILATSREPLNILGETTWIAPTLSLPDVQGSVLLENLMQYDAVRLFMERAAMAMPTFSLNTQKNAVAIAQVCQSLDGLPLAIELAAVHVRALTVEQLAAHLNSRFHLLTSGNRAAPPRHQTLEAMIDWSYNLLPEKQQGLFQRLSVFAGGWTLEAVETVCSDEAIQALEVAGLLSTLVNHSLVVADTQGELPRYRMLETIRQYANNKLWAVGEAEILRQRHLAYFVELAVRAEPNLRAFDMVRWLDRLEAELDNIRIALEYALESDIEAQLRLASALQWFWHIRGHRNEGIDWLERGLPIEKAERGDLPLTPSRAMIRGKALNISGILMAMFFSMEKAPERLKESLALFQKLGDSGKRGAAYALWGLAGSTPAHYIPIRSLLDQSLTLFREIGDKFGTAECLMSLAGSFADEGDYRQASIVAEEQLALRREIGDEDGIAIALDNLSNLAFEQGDYERAIALHEESLSIFRRLKNKWGIGYGLSTFGDVFMWQGDYKGATNIYQEVLAFAQDISDSFLSAYGSYSLSVLTWLEGNYTAATNMLMDCLPVFQEVGNQWMVIGTQHTFGDLAFAQGNTNTALQWYEAELTLSREMQITEGIILSLNGIGKVAWISGDYKLAEEKFREALKMSPEKNLKFAAFYAFYGLGRIAQSRGIYTQAREFYGEALKTHRRPTAHLFHWVSVKTYSSAIACPIGALAALAILDNQMERAVKLLGASEHTYKLIQFQLTPTERAEHDQAIAAARAALGEEAFAAAYEKGRKMTIDEAVSYALKEN